MKKTGLWNRVVPLALMMGCASFCWLPELPAQGQTYDSGKPDVEVDSSVLNQLGPSPSLPDMLLQRAPVEPGGTIRLIPPHGRQSKKTARKSSAIHLHRIHHQRCLCPQVRHHKPIKTSHAAAVKTLAPPAAEPAAPSGGPIALTPTLAPAPVTAPASAPAPAPAAATPAPPVSEPVRTPAPVAAASTIPDNSPAPAPAPAQKSALTAQAAGTEIAPVPPSAPGGLSSIAFEKETARLPDGAKDILAHVASRMVEDGSLEVQLLAYAAGDEESSSKARRLSLSRALAVRSFLIEQGVRSTRIEVRSLGNKVPDGQPDRVDLLVQKRG